MANLRSYNPYVKEAYPLKPIVACPLKPVVGMFIAQSCPTFVLSCMDCRLPGFLVHGILKARILERAAISFSRGSS